MKPPIYPSIVSVNSNPFQLRTPDGEPRGAEPSSHVYGRSRVICATEGRGYPTPGNVDRARIVLDATEGFIPLWAKDTTLRWRIQERAIERFVDPPAARGAIMGLMSDALLAWGDAAPIRFSEHSDAWDFEVVVMANDDCRQGGCVLAKAFFPDSGRHQLELYPRLFTQTPQEQKETLIHEFGHVFGLRHFFAQIRESRWASELFGTHSPFTIMNYGEQSVLTDADRSDLTRLYHLAWCGAISHVNGTPIRFVQPFHTGIHGDSMQARTPSRSAATAPILCARCGCAAG